MSYAARMPYHDPDENTARWVLIFVLASLLFHAVLVLAIILISIYCPPRKLDLVTPETPEVSLSFLPPPPKLAAPPPPKHIFMPTHPQQNVPPKETLIESDNDTRVTSQSKTSRAPDSVMPDVVSKTDHSSDLQNSPNSPSRQKPQQALSPPAPKPQPQQQQRPQTPPQPKTAQTQPQNTTPQPNPSTAQKPPLNPPKVPAPKAVQYDPNGLPELPALDAPALAPQTQATTQSTQSSVPPALLPQVAANVQGRAGLSGAPSPEAMATELGRYKAKVYRAVGSHWYEKVGRQLQLLGVGSVHIQFTIHSDGTVETKVLDSGNSTMQLLLSISLNSIREAAPFDPFSPAMQKEVGDSYTDDFTFSIYGE